MKPARRRCILWYVGVGCLFFVSVRPARAQSQAHEPTGEATAVDAASPDAPLSVTQDPTPQACGLAVPNCFTDCGVGQVRTGAGRCVPQALPGYPVAPSRGRDGLIDAKAFTDFAAAPAGTDAPTGDPEASPETAASATADTPPAAKVHGPVCCRVPIVVEAVGIRNLGDRAERSRASADVLINGQLIGTTPFEDALPPGDYRIEVRLAGFAPLSRGVVMRSGQRIRVAARYWVALDQAQLASRDAFRKARQQSLTDARVQAWHEEVAAADKARQKHAAAVRAAYDKWQTDTAQTRDRRASMHTWGFVGAAVGAAATVAGVALLATSAATDNDASAAFKSWQRETDANTRAVLSARIDDLETARSTELALGIGFTAVGVAALVGGTWLASSAPEVPEAPEAPPDDDRVRLTWSPLVGPQLSGIRASLSF